MRHPLRSLALTLTLTMAAVAAGYEPRVVHVVEQLRELDQVGGASVGYGGTPHEFFLLFEYCLRASTDGDLVEMLRDPSPVVRIMGAKCILKSPYRQIDRAQVSALLGDPTHIVVGPGGCVFTTMTVGNVVRELLHDPNYLGPFNPSADDGAAGSGRVAPRPGVPFDAVVGREIAGALGCPAVTRINELAALLAMEWRGRTRMEGSVFLRTVARCARPLSSTIGMDRDGESLGLTRWSELLGTPTETVRLVFRYDERDRISAVECTVEPR